jgi:hypothetical protein
LASAYGFDDIALVPALTINPSEVDISWGGYLLREADAIVVG